MEQQTVAYDFAPKVAPFLKLQTNNYATKMCATCVFETVVHSSCVPV